MARPLCALVFAVLAASLSCATAEEEPRPTPPATSPTTATPPAARPAPPSGTPTAGVLSGVRPHDPSDRPVFGHGRLEAVTGAGGKPAGVRVVRVQQGGRLWRLGLKPGDLLLRINGRPLADPATFDQAVAVAERVFISNEIITVRLNRDGEEFSLAEMRRIKDGAASPP